MLDFIDGFQNQFSSKKGAKIFIKRGVKYKKSIILHLLFTFYELYSEKYVPYVDKLIQYNDFCCLGKRTVCYNGLNFDLT